MKNGVLTLKRKRQKQAEPDEDGLQTTQTQSAQTETQTRTETQTQTESTQLKTSQLQTRKKKRGPLEAAVQFFSNLMDRYLPDPFVIAIFLTVTTMALAVIVRGTNPLKVVDYWGAGLWDLLAFSMQMTLVLLSGYVLAKTPPVDRFLDSLASKIYSPRVAIATATVVAGVGSWLNWGFGLVMGGIVAQKLAMNVKGLHYPLAIAAGYSGFAVFGFGISAPVPLLLATPGSFMEKQVGVIPLSETVFTPQMLLTTLATLIILPLFTMLLHPTDPAKVREIDRAAYGTVAAKPAQDDAPTIASRSNNSRVVGIGFGLIAMVFAARYFLKGGALNLDMVNFMLLFLAVLLFTRPSAFLTAVNDGVKIVTGLIVQYPFYAGIMAILSATGLAVAVADAFGAFATAESLPFWSFISAGFLNIFMPSGGGQFAVQGPVMAEAATALGADQAATAMAVQIGDQWTNMIQPFWILPALAISGLKLRDVMGYLVLILVVLGIIYTISVLVWGFLLT
ncbi:TIGR00366 family protein [Pseudoglutamicibacter cumminsii]|uniref:TIGR00366 family protein n=2 Tax=Pseudoglutamicibacter cumminsii TaxID=156979 RepID=A0AAP4C821_9MICC|nr:TIGR00366 family protein [Pseudoglutamicibacter cumminsii]MDK6275110.1 TIGR00366 family protein [Pseudoglutamicibacter cumminsii]